MDAFSLCKFWLVLTVTIEKDPNLVLINKKNADQADYLIGGGITSFDTYIDREKKDNRKYCTKGVFVYIRYQPVDV